MLLGPVATAGCASAGAGPEPGTAPVAEPDLDRLEALYQARADSALMMVSQADVDFMTGMIHHHAQALVMSALAPANGASAALLTLTSRITNAQKDEIAIMQRWLRERGRPVPTVDADGRMSGASVGAMAMPGMLSRAQLEELTAATGVQYDRLFLTYMIQHHDGAVTMVHDLFATDGAAQDEFVFKIASDIQVDQITEIARMQQMLDGLPSEPER
jgi:uncharacterized protein (DUF305 family)